SAINLVCKVCVSQWAHNSTLEATPARTHGKAAVWVGLTLSDRFYTPTLIRPDNERDRDGSCARCGPRSEDEACEATGIRHASLRCGGCMAARGARTATGKITTGRRVRVAAACVGRRLAASMLGGDHETFRS